MPRGPKLPHTLPRRSANVAQPTQQLIDATAVRWWRWRHCYLEAMQLALQERQRAVEAAGAAAAPSAAATGAQAGNEADSTP